MRGPFPVWQVNRPEGKLILSERAAMTSQLAKQLKPGDIVDGIVTRLRDFGAFVALRSPDGSMHGVEVMVALSFIKHWNYGHEKEAFTGSTTAKWTLHGSYNHNKGASRELQPQK